MKLMPYDNNCCAAGVVSWHDHYVTPFHFCMAESENDEKLTFTFPNLKLILWFPSCPST